MSLALTKVANVNDFKNASFQKIIEKYLPHYYDEVTNHSHELFQSTFCNRKTWEIVMALYSFDRYGMLDGTNEFLGIGAAKEETISVLSRLSRRVFATDIYLDPSTWGEWHDRNLLIDARSHMDANYNHRRVVWQHVDGTELPYEDDSFDGIFSCSSIEHFGDEQAIRKSLEEVCRVLKPGGVAAVSSEYKISGEGDGFANVQLFDTDRLQRVWLDGIDWECVDFIDDKLDDSDFIDFHRVVNDAQYRSVANAHIKLDNHQYQWTSVHLTLVKNVT